jgi:hypothetical protein
MKSRHLAVPFPVVSGREKALKIPVLRLNLVPAYHCIQILTLDFRQKMILEKQWRLDLHRSRLWANWVYVQLNHPGGFYATATVSSAGLSIIRAQQRCFLRVARCRNPDSDGAFVC